MKNCNKNGQRIASWHFTVDDKEIYQAAPANMRCYHAGTSRGNNTSIGIEICMYSDSAKQKKAYDNAIALVKILMSFHGFGISQVKQHYNWSRKDCPTWLRSGKFGYNWTWFKNQITSNSTVTQPSTGTGTNGSFVVKITTASLNVRKGPGTSYSVVTTVKKGEAYTITEVQGSWGKLKSGVGWINISPNYVKRV
jgi:N-acetylmuramoyl-L-alanine amidase